MVCKTDLNRIQFIHSSTSNVMFDTDNQSWDIYRYLEPPKYPFHLII